MVTAEPPCAAAPTLALALARIAALCAAGFDLVYPAPGELARLRKGNDVVIVRAAPIGEAEQGVFP